MTDNRIAFAVGVLMSTGFIWLVGVLRREVSLICVLALVADIRPRITISWEET